MRVATHALLLIYGTLTVLQPSRTAACQTNARGGVITGQVADTALRGIASAHVSVPGFASEATTDSAGRFRLSYIPPGDRLLIVQRIGFQAAKVIVAVSIDDTARITVTLQSSVRQLEKVVIQNTAVDPWLGEFERRRELHQGEYATSADIERLGFATTSGVLSTFKSISIQKSMVLNRRSFPRQCPLRIFVDGVSLNVRVLEADLPPPPEIAALEVYVNTASVPAQYATYGGTGDVGGGGAFCGLILIWRKH